MPLAMAFDRLAKSRAHFRVTLSLSPTLLTMLQDELLVSRYHGYLDRRVALAESEVDRTRRGPPALAATAAFYLRRFSRVREAFRERYGSQLLRPLLAHRGAGRIELMTSAATHGFLPLLDGVPQAVRAQVLVGAEDHRHRTGRAAAGFWLPECGYLPAHERFLAEAGMRYSFLEAHGLLGADPPPPRGLLVPVLSSNGIAFFGRDPQTSAQVWSAEVGYPSHADYREFHRDAGWELGLGRNVGIKYHRITGPVPLAEKAPYDPARARARAVAHAANFLARRQEQVQREAASDTPPVVVSPYDAELFGHWWFEGPEFLEALLRLVSAQRVVEPIAPSEYLDRHPPRDRAQPAASSWGAQGYSAVWLDPSNDWMYPHLDAAAEQMVQLARSHLRPTPLQRRALAQAGRELLLAQSSDWAFILKMGTAVEYAERRFRDHIGRFQWLRRALLTGGIDETVLRSLEQRDNVFPRPDYRVYR